MHEYGLAADIVRGVQAEAAAAGGKRLASLEVEVGALTRLETDTLAFWLAEELAEHLGDAAITADRVRVFRAPLTVTCRRCGNEAAVQADDDDLVLIDPRARRCSGCGSDDVKLDGGTGWTIQAAWAEDGSV
jgi:Zn finger protein HypA/HybF involved in hydrogenase expression